MSQRRRSREDGHAGQLYELTGPDLMAFPKAVDELPGRWGQDPLIQLSSDEYAHQLESAQIPPELVSLILIFLPRSSTAAMPLWPTALPACWAPSRKFRRVRARDSGDGRVERRARSDRCTLI